MTHENRESQEKLGTVFLNGELHAMYPTALRTACQIEHPPQGEDLHLYPPTCTPCRRVARAWMHIDHATPQSWWAYLRHNHLECDECLHRGRKAAA